MTSTHSSLAAQANERTARLAALKNLKRKQAPTDEQGSDTSTTITITTDKAPAQESDVADVTRLHLSGRNYDAGARGPRLGFEEAPTAGESTLEVRAAALKEETARLQVQQDEEAGKPLDLWRLQPKRPNWDLKRDLEAKMARVNVRTDNAIARLVRQRVLDQQERAKREHSADGADGAGAGLEGAALVEGVHMREREEDDEREDEGDEDSMATTT